MGDGATSTTTNKEATTIPTRVRRPWTPLPSGFARCEKILLAVAVVHGPSHGLRRCVRCSACWREIAELGFAMHLVTEPLNYTRGGLNDGEQRFALLELT